MTGAPAVLQRLLEGERAKSGARAVVLRAASGDGRFEFGGAAGEASPPVRFPIASISKSFTAALILKLADMGRLDLEQTVQSVLPQHDLSDVHVIKGVSYGQSLTIRHLLFKTSGLADYFKGGIEAEMLSNKDRRIDLELVLQMTRAQRPLAVPDSGRAQYSDTNYQLLGAVIEAVTGAPYAAALEEHICAPLGLRQTSTFADSGGGVLGIYQKSQRLDLPLSLASMDPDGGLVSTSQELIAFLRGFLAGRLFSPDHLAAIRTWRPMVLPLEYGGGLMRVRLPRWMTLWRRTPELIGHLGSSGSFAFYAPQRDIYLAGTFNQTDLPRRPVRFMLQVLGQLERYGEIG